MLDFIAMSVCFYVVMRSLPVPIGTICNIAYINHTTAYTELRIPKKILLIYQTEYT